MNETKTYKGIVSTKATLRQVIALSKEKNTQLNKQKTYCY